ncbi:MAG: hypothetical protein JXN61_18325 [Sedimentisphaerales bacterium]|nr:hypothetical protein [Sedimentisphaerales bacterium]
MRHPVGIGFLVVLPVLGAFGRDTQVEFCPASPDAVFEQRITAKIQGNPTRLEYYKNAVVGMRHFMDTSRARFAADGPVRIELDFRGADIQAAHLRALGRDLDFAKDGSNLSFKLPGPGHYYLQLPGLAKPMGTYTVLFWIDDLEKLGRTRIKADSPGVTDVTVSGVKSDSEKDQTSAIQSILDKGGTVYFPPGIYLSSTLQIGSDTTVYMAGGAMLKAVDDDSKLGKEFIAIENAKNVKILGQGTIDANGRVAYGNNSHNVNITSSQKILFEDVLFQNSHSWAVHIRRSDKFTARNVKVFSGKDGFDPDSSRDVLLDGVFIVSIDDAVAVKNRYPDEPDGRTTERIVIRNAIVSSTKSSLKIGTETRGPMRYITFENCDVYDGERGIVMYARDGGPIEKAVWCDIRLFMIDWAAEKNSGKVFHLIKDKREAVTPISDCLIENVTANFIYRSEFAGLAESPLAGIKISNVEVNVGKPKEGKPYLFHAGDYVDLTIEGLTVNWQGNRDRWAGVVSGSGLNVKGLKELAE